MGRYLISTLPLAASNFSSAKELVSTFKHHFDEEKLEAAKGKVEIKYLPNTVDTLHISTYAQIVEQTFEVVKD